MKSRFLTLACAALSTCLPACSPKTPPEAQSTSPMVASTTGDAAPNKPGLFQAPAFFTPQTQNQQPDAVKEQQYLIQLIAYRVTLPSGGVSRSDDFWKHVNEQAVDAGTYEMLFKNGIRVGVAGVDEFEYLKGLVEKHPVVTQPSSWTGREARNLDIDLKLKVDYQNLFSFNSAGELAGRTYERCDDLLRISFQPAPRKHGSVRIAVCPVIKSLREVVVPIGEIHSTSYKWIRPEHLFDLNMVVDVPLDSFLVIAPAAEGEIKALPGSVFLRGEGAAERTETLLLFRPLIFRHGAELGGGAKPLTTDKPMNPVSPLAPASAPAVAPSQTQPAAEPAAPAGGTEFSPFKRN